MALTNEQREARRSYIGSSDAAAILGLDPRRNASDVWAEKTGKVMPWDGNKFTEGGNLFEPVLLDYAERELGELHRNVMLTKGNLCANLDALGDNFIVEAKVVYDPMAVWGEPGTDAVPDVVNVQVAHQMYVADELPMTYVVRLVAMALKFELFAVPRNAGLCEMVAEEGQKFFDKFVKTDTRPDDYRPSMETLKRMRRTPKKVMPVDAEIVDAWLVAKAAAKQADDEAEGAKLALIQAIDDAEAGQLPDGRLVTYYEQTRKGYQVKDSTFRTLRLKK